MRIWRALIAALVIAIAPAVARAEVTELKIPLGAGGFGFLPLHMMQKYNLIEKYAEEAGLKVTVSWSNIGGPAVMNDALLSGSAHFISAGPPAFLTLWDRTRGNMGVKSIAAIELDADAPERARRAVEVAGRNCRGQEDRGHRRQGIDPVHHHADVCGEEIRPGCKCSASIPAR